MITILQTLHNQLATKKVQKDSSGNITIIPFGRSTYFKVEQVQIEGIQQLSELLVQLEQQPNKFIVRGTLDSGADLSRPIRRRGSGGYSDINEAPFSDTEQSWMMLDFDDVDCPVEIDLTKDPEAAISHLISLLPEEFKDVTCHWQLSSGAGIKKGIRAHLWYWLSEPMTSYDLKERWVKQFNSQYAAENNQKKKYKLVDPALFQAVQPHYTAAPIFEDVSDPLSQRSGFLQGTKGAVALNLDFSHLPTPDSSSTGAGSLRSAGGFYNILDRIGDDGDGFNDPLSRAAASYAAEHGRDKVEASVDSLKEIFRESICEADQSNHSQDQIDRYLSDSYLDDIIRSAVKKFGDNEKLDPYFEREELEIDEARDLLRDKLEKWSYLVHNYNQCRFREPQDRSVECYVMLTRQLVVGIKAAAGVGKTTGILKNCFNTGVFHGNVEFYVPSHALSEQLRVDIEEKVGEQYREALDELNIKANESQIATIIRGRDQEGYCKKREEVDRVVKIGLSVSSVLCGDEQNGYCEFYDECLYQKQFQQTERFESFDDALTVHDNLGSVPTVTIMAHNHLFLHTRDRLPVPEMAIVDESFFGHAVEELEVPLKELRHKNPILKAITSALTYHEPLLKALREDDVTPTDLYDLAKDLDGDRRKIDIVPSMPHEQQKSVLQEIQARPKLPQIIRWLAKELEWHSRDESHVVSLHEYDDEPSKVIASKRKNLTLPVDVPVLFIDADIDRSILQRFFREKVRIASISAKRIAKVYQFKDKTFSDSSLLTSKDSDVLLNQVIQFIKSVSRGSKTLVATTKKIRAGMTGENPRGKLDKTTDFAGAKIVHFSTLRGLNDFEEYDNVIVIGRSQMPVDSLQEKASAIFYDDESPLTFIEPDEKGDLRLKNGRRGYRMSNGKEESSVQYHPDRRIQKVLEQSREAESCQAIDRLRVVNDRGDKLPNIFVLSNVPLDLTVDHAVSWKEFQKVQAIWDESGGVFPMHPEDLLVLAPDSSGSLKTAKRMRGRYLEAESLVRCFIPEQFTKYRYKTAKQRGEGYSIYIADRLEMKKEKLSALLGHDVSLLEKLND